MVAAALGIGAAVAGLGGAALSASAAGSAADTASASADRASALQQQRYETTRNDLMPYSQAGYGALGRLQQIFGLGPSGPYQGSGTSVGQPQMTATGQPVGVGQPMPAGGGAPQYAADGRSRTGGYLPPGWTMLDSGDGSGTQSLIDDKGNPLWTFSGAGADAQAQQWMQERGIAATPQATTAPGFAAGQNALMPQGGMIAGALPGAGSSVTPYAAPNGGVFSFDQSNLANTPGYQFQLDQGIRAANASAAARGGLQSGAALKAAAGFGNDLASTTWQNQLGAQQGIFGTNLNSSIALNNLYYDKNIAPLIGLAGSGQNAATQLGALGNQSAATQGVFTNASGQNQAAGTLYGANALARGIGGAANQIGQWVGSTYGNQPNPNLPSGDFSNGGNYSTYTQSPLNTGGWGNTILGGV